MVDDLPSSSDNAGKGRELKNDERTSITSGDGVSCLLLQDITADDSGKYDVCIENVYGADSNYASVSVEGPPDPPSGTPCISANQDSVTVAWSSSPYDGGKIVNGYAVEYSMVGSDIWTMVVDECHSLSYVVRGLQPGGRYVFRVRALNVHGYSRPSHESDVVVLEEQNLGPAQAIVNDLYLCNESISFEPRVVSVEPGPEFKSRYEVLEEIGKGRFGVVHKVVEKGTSQKLAAKFIKCRTSKDRDKVQDEIDIMNLLRHQKLPPIGRSFRKPQRNDHDYGIHFRWRAFRESGRRTKSRSSTLDSLKKSTPRSPSVFFSGQFIPPEIINYDPIGVESDMWSLGVICYVLLSGLSPFMGDNDSETFANITRADYDFEDEAFNTVSQNARDFIGALLVERKENRLSAEQCLKHVWLDPETHQETVVLCTDKLKKFIIRRKWQKTGNAIRALGRMATLSASRRNSANSTPNTPRTSLSGTLIPRMSSVNEEDSLHRSISSATGNSSIKAKLDEVCKEIENLAAIEATAEEDTETCSPLRASKDVKNENNTTIKSRACTERSDSGISDCSTHITSSSSTSTPLLSKKFCINEEVECPNEEKVFSTSTTLFLNRRNNSIEEERRRNGIGESCENMDENDHYRYKSKGSFHSKPHPVSSLKLSDKIESFNNAPIKCKSPSAPSGLKRLPIYTSRTVAGTRKKFDTSNGNPDISIQSVEKTNGHPNKIHLNNKIRDNSNDNDSNRKTRSHFGTVERKGEKHVSRVEKIMEKLSGNENSAENALSSAPTTIRYRSPSPSILRKAQAVMAKEQPDGKYTSNDVDSPQGSPMSAPKFGSINITCPKSPLVNRKDKPKSESFQKAAAFWNSPKT
ncbi:hypothetical protein JTB14_024376 [Gonioctena quinquepunctata]|nr:hypothetical protein JTB14_024376 [Gonioctena quinquepunctata]